MLMLVIELLNQSSQPICDTLIYIHHFQTHAAKLKCCCCVVWGINRLFATVQTTKCF